jgi:hypothetical protein
MGLHRTGPRRAAVLTSLAAVALCLPASAVAQDSAPYQPVWHLEYQTPNADAGTGLLSVTAPSKNDAWAVGTIGRKHATGYIVHWNGRHWRRVALPAYGFRPWVVNSSAPDDVWVFGTTRTGNYQVFYRSAAGWQAIPAPPVTPADQYVFGGLVVNAADVWLQSAPVLHWNGQHWQHVRLPRGFELTGFADAGGTIWAVGLRDFSADGQGRVAVYRLHHGRWRSLAMPHRRGFIASVVADRAHSVFVSVTRQKEGFDTTVLYWNGRRWRTLPRAADAPVYFLPVAGFGAKGLWLGTNLLWNGSQWISISQHVDGQAQLVVTDEGGIAQIPGTRSSWLVMPAGTSPKRGLCGQIWVAGRLPH